MKFLAVPLRRLPHAADLPLPRYETPHAAGMDLLAAVSEPLLLPPGGRAVIPTGIAVALPREFEAQIRPRSGLAARHGVTVLNSPGTIDPDYRGEVGVILVNLGGDPFVVTRGMRIAQLVLAPLARAHWQEQQELPESSRGVGGFGSTGLEQGG